MSQMPPGMFMSGGFSVLQSGVTDYPRQPPIMSTLDFLLEKFGADEERQLIASVRQRRPNAHLIYGDWLEEYGRLTAAKAVREGWVP